MGAAAIRRKREDGLPEEHDGQTGSMSMKRHFPLAACMVFILAPLAAQQQQQQPPQQQPPAQQMPRFPGIAPSVPYVAPSQAAQPQPQQQQPQQQQPQQQPAAQPAAVQRNGQPVQPRLSETDTFSMDNVSLVEMIDVIAKRLKINYILDPKVQGAVSIHTYGAMPDVDLMPLLQTILRVNGDAIVQVGNLYHIVPINSVGNLPTQPLVNGDPKTMPDDERMVLNLIFLKFTMADEMDKLLEPFMGEGARHSVYAPANLLIIEDNSRSMKRTMELIQMFDSDTFAGERVKLFDVAHSRPSDLVKQLDNVFKAYAYSDKNSAVHFIPIDSINTLLAVAPNPDVFVRVKDWIDKLDVEPKPNSSGTQFWSYRMNYGRAEVVAAAIMALYTGNANALMQMASSMNNSMMQAGMGMGNLGMSGYGAGGLGGGYGNGSGYGNVGGSNAAYAGFSPGMSYGQQPVSSPTGIASSTPYAAPPGAMGTAGQTGGYLMPASGQLPPSVPFVIPNPFDNTIMVKGTGQDIDQIKELVKSLDVAPRQVLIDAKIYEVDLDNELAEGVESYLQKVGSTNATSVTGNSNSPSGLSTIGGLAPTTALAAAGGPGGLALTVGGLVTKSTQLIAVLNAAEGRGKSRVISAPSIIATDSIPATMNVGTQVPTLSSQAVVPGVQNNGSSVFANTVSTESSGVTLSIVARINSSGIVTMMIDQQVSAPIAPSAGAAIQSPSFSNRSVSTQVTVHDGDTIAIGGAILEQRTDATAGIPVLSHIPVLGPLFGARNTTLARTELIIFLTPRVIYDTTQMTEATEEIKSNLKRVGKLIKEQ
jgi:general secretion pathway protein D